MPPKSVIGAVIIGGRIGSIGTENKKMVYQFLQYRIVVIGGGLSVRRCQVGLKAGVSGVSLSGSHAENPSNRIPKVRKSVCGFIDYVLLVPESVIPGDLIIEFEFFQVQIGIGRDGNVNIFI